MPSSIINKKESDVSFAAAPHRKVHNSWLLRWLQPHDSSRTSTDNAALTEMPGRVLNVQLLQKYLEVAQRKTRKGKKGLLGAQSTLKVLYQYARNQMDESLKKSIVQKEEVW